MNTEEKIRYSTAGSFDNKTKKANKYSTQQKASVFHWENTGFLLC